MNHGWKYRKLCDVAPAKSFDGDIAPTSEDKYWCLNLDKIESDTGRIIEYDYLGSAELHGSICKFSIENVLFSKLRPNLNKVVVPMQDGYCTTELVPLHPIKELNRKFLSYYLRNPKFVRVLVDKTGGAKMPRVKMNMFWDCEIPLPKLEIQNRIASELDKINELIEVKRSQLADLDLLAQSLFYEMFGDPINNPKGWRTTLFGNLIRLKSGDALSAKFFCDGSYPVYGGNGIAGYHNRYNVSGENIIIGRVGALCGNVRFINGDIFVTDNAFVVKVQQNIKLRFLERMLTLLELRKYANAAAQPVISNTSLKAITIPIPPIELQNEFAAKIEAIEKQKEQIESSITDLQTLLASRMDYWFND